LRIVTDLPRSDPLEQLRRQGWNGQGGRTALLDRVTMANDASHYVLTPQAVVHAGSAEEIVGLMTAAARAGVPLTFRSGGTSLSGQAVTAGVMVDTRRAFLRVQVLDSGRAVRAEPGATIGAVNAALRSFGTKAGPDPASEAACTIGGVIANNSSGMTCGTSANSYRTLQSMRFALPSGTVIDTADHDADAQLARLEPGIHSGLLRLRDRLRADDRARSAIETLFAIKNTMGYGLNSFLDFDTPSEILAHLMVGSEGTLGFIASATLRTIPVLPHAVTGLLVLPDLRSAAHILPALIDSGPAVVELLDTRSLRVAASGSEPFPVLLGPDLGSETALLVEYRAANREDLDELVTEAEARFDWTPPSSRLTEDPGQRNALWKIRKGLYAAVAASRPKRTTALLEDVAVPVAVLPETCAELETLFAWYGYRDSVIFGHAKDGNIHFMVCERFDDPAGVDRYAAFTEDMVELILDHGGTLKAEHGTGRVMASFVRRQYGDDLYRIMEEIKQLCDPVGILNPDVVLTQDAAAHLRHLKTYAPVESEVDRCVECGFCEPVCPSRYLTLTPRQRIVARRARAAASQAGDDVVVRELDAAYRYAGVQTCAADGMCQTACPVGIDTGDLARRLRAADHGRAAMVIGRATAAHWAGATTAAAALLNVAHAFPAATESMSRSSRKVLSAEMVPRFTPDLPRGGTRRSATPHRPSPDLVFFPSCTGTLFASAGPRSTRESFLSLCAKAGIQPMTPDGIPGLCCGMPWTSKGLTSGAEVMTSRLHAMLSSVKADRPLLVVSDASSCTEGLLKATKDLSPDQVKIEDAVEFTAREILPRLHVEPTSEIIAVHRTCSSVRGKTDDALMILANALSPNLFTPPSWGCCAFAGDRGLLHPELHDSATRRQADEIRQSGATIHISCNRTCEIGMTRAVGRPYRHVLEVLDELSRTALLP
jgi:D-lactate dehydrogenase